MAGLMFACLSALDEAGLSAIAERMFELVRDPSQKVPHRLAGVRVIINVEKHRFAHLKQRTEQLPASTPIDDPLHRHPASTEAGGSIPRHVGLAEVFTPERASELLAVLDCLVQQADLEPTYRLRASTLAIAIHRLALQEQTWLDQQSTGANGHSKRASNVPTRASPNRSPTSSAATTSQIRSRADRPPTHDPRATDSPMTSVPFTQGNRELDLLDPDEQRWLAPLVVDRRSAEEKPGSPAMTNDRFRDERVSHPPWDNDQSYVTISGCDVEPEFSHRELVPSLRFEPPDD